MRYRFAFDTASTPSLVFDVDQALSFQSRRSIARAIRERNDLNLCGDAVTCPGRAS